MMLAISHERERDRERQRETERDRDSTVGILDATVFTEMRDLIPLHVFLIFFQFVSKYLS